MDTFQEGLRKAYEAESGLYADGGTLYVAGTRGLRDVSQWPLIPTNKTRNLDIYKRMDEYLSQNPNIKNLVGHSAGGSAVLEKA